MRTDYISTDSISALLWALTPADKLICEICLATGWRIGDIVSLTTQELDRALSMKRPTLHIIEEKTGERSSKRVSRELLNRMREQAGRIYVFEGRDDYRKHRTRQAVFYDIKRVALRFGIKLNLAPHSLRKNYAVWCYDEYGIERAQRELNHDNIECTLFYVLSREMQSRHGVHQKKRKKKSRT